MAFLLVSDILFFVLSVFTVSCSGKGFSTLQWGRKATDRTSYILRCLPTKPPFGAQQNFIIRVQRVIGFRMYSGDNALCADHKPFDLEKCIVVATVI
jgi:hypothetical protein